MVAVTPPTVTRAEPLPHQCSQAPPSPPPLAVELELDPQPPMTRTRPRESVSASASGVRLLGTLPAMGASRVGPQREFGGGEGIVGSGRPERDEDDGEPGKPGFGPVRDVVSDAMSLPQRAPPPH